MSTSEPILEALKTSGERITVARRAIIRTFSDVSSPLTALALLDLLQKQKFTFNKTTVYREVKFLEEKGIIRSLQFDERNKRYELVAGDHKHHLICTTCKKIEDVVLDHDLDHVEEKLKTQTTFKVQRHELEFYGVCAACQD